MFVNQTITTIFSLHMFAQFLREEINKLHYKLIIF